MFVLQTFLSVVEGPAPIQLSAMLHATSRIGFTLRQQATAPDPFRTGKVRSAVVALCYEV